MAKRNKGMPVKGWSLPMLALVVIVALLQLVPNLQPAPAPAPPAAAGELLLDFIDVGQGDCILIRSQEAAMLIDAGWKSSGAAVVAYLQDLGLSKLDYVVATHPHADHIGGLVAVIETFACGTVIMPPVTHTSAVFEELLDTIAARGYQITPAQAGDVYALGAARCSVLAPAAGADYDDLNNYSVVLRLEYGNNAFLLMGDAEQLVEDALLDSGTMLSADVLKLGHHGSNTSSSAAFLEAVRPQYALALCGADNEYGHPHQEVVQRLQERGIALLRTDQQGSIQLRCDGATITIP